MAQHDYVIANQGFPAFRSDLNDALAAVVSNNSGATEPTTMFAHQMWVDTAADPSILKIRNADNDAWITIGTINQTGDTFTLTSAVSATTLNTSGAVVFNDAGADVDFRVEGDTDANLLFVDASADKIGIGTSSPAVKLELSANDSVALRLTSTDTGATADDVLGSVEFYGSDASSAGAGVKSSIVATAQGVGGAASDLRFSTSPGATNNAERMRIDSSGNLIVAKTALAFSDVGCEMRANGFGAFTRSAAIPLAVNRLTDDGDIVQFAKDSTVVGSIGSVSGVALFIGSPTSGNTGFMLTTNQWRPVDDAGNIKDDAIDIGQINARLDDIYATNGTIQISDRNEKQDIEDLSEAETRVAVAAKNLMKKYRWKSAVAEKGDDARIHFGIIAQDLKAAFEAEGLDAGRYAMFIHSEWWETQTEVPAVEAQEAVYEIQTDEEGNEVQVLVSEAVEGKEAYTRTDTYETEAEAPEGAVRKERMGVRYSELLAFIIAAI